MIRYAVVNGEKVEPAKGLKGFCPGCNTAVTAKCGLIRVHHWAHLQASDCDAWWEPITQWHLDWQNQFPSEWREVICRDPDSAEFHRADIYTTEGLTIEFQYSPLSAEQILRRNQFYKKLIWVVSGERFKERFRIGDSIPNPRSPKLANYNFTTHHYLTSSRSAMYFQKIDELKELGSAARGYDIRDKEMQFLKDEQLNNKNIYRLFSWEYKHATWLNCSAPVFLDFGDDFLYWLRSRAQVGPPLTYLQVVTKVEFLAKYAPEVTNDKEYNN